jgi:hypothetical protein
MGENAGRIGNPLNTWAILFDSKAVFVGVLKSDLATKSA